MRLDAMERVARRAAERLREISREMAELRGKAMPRLSRQQRRTADRKARNLS
jgi:hypothetical protein